VNNGERIVDSADVTNEKVVNNQSSSRDDRSAAANSSLAIRRAPLDTLRYPAAIYVLFTVAIYWPVFLGHRFFWEDFFIQEYPIRDFCFYMARFHHALPFWNPYSWSWSPLLADAQSAFWYPTNLLQIAITWIVAPQTIHLPVIVPETMTLLHLPLASLGVFMLLKKEFRVAPAAALLAGLCWGFGIRMVAEQNHSMQIIQLALLPWETLLLMGAWRSWRYAIGLGLLFGVSFLAGQQQTFFYIAIFLASFTLAETLTRLRKKENATLPFLNFSIAMAIAVGVSSIQLLHSWELVGLSSRSHLDFYEASSAALHLGHLINFFDPKFYGENPGFNIPKSSIVNDTYWYWEATFYWGALAEIIALFAIVCRWNKRVTGDVASRYILFIALFSVLSFAFALGRNLYFQWLIWKFVPLFDHFRAPNRMVWFLWFLGTLMTGVGIDQLLKHPEDFRKYRRYFLWSCGVFAAINFLSIVGIFDLIFKPHIIRNGLWALLFPSLLTTILIATFLTICSRANDSSRILSPKILLASISILIAGDLFYNDFNWHRNTLNPESFFENESKRSEIAAFTNLHSADHAKLLIHESDSLFKKEASLGMFLRLPIEFGSDSDRLLDINPLRLSGILPPVRDSIRRMEIMGVTMLSDSAGETNLIRHLPFLKLYDQWHVVSGDSQSKTLNDTSFDFAKEILLSELPLILSATNNLSDTAILLEYSENLIRISVAVSQPSVLLVNDLYYPAWKAFVDGKETKILRAFTSLRGIPVSAGQHKIELRYESNAFNIGWKITLGTLAISILGLFIGRKEKSPAG